jgi:hypothetical protein
LEKVANYLDASDKVPELMENILGTKLKIKKQRDPLKPKRILSHRFGFKMPKGGGVLRNPYKAIYNRVYNYVAKKLF